LKNHVPRLVTLVILVLLLGGGLSACNVSSARSTCKGGICTVTVAGTSRHIVEIFDHQELVVDGITEDAASVTVRGNAVQTETATVREGETVTIGNANVKLESAKLAGDRKAKLVVTRS
jgi:hypothetical protein